MAWRLNHLTSNHASCRGNHTSAVLTCVLGCHGDGSLRDSEAVARWRHNDRTTTRTTEPCNRFYPVHQHPLPAAVTTSLGNRRDPSMPHSASLRANNTKNQIFIFNFYQISAFFNNNNNNNAQTISNAP